MGLLSLSKLPILFGEFEHVVRVGDDIVFEEVFWRFPGTFVAFVISLTWFFFEVERGLRGL